MENYKKTAEILKDLRDAKIDEDLYIRTSMHVLNACIKGERIHFTKTQRNKIAVINTIKISYDNDLKNVIITGQLDNV